MTLQSNRKFGSHKVFYTEPLCLFPHKVPIQPRCGAVLLTYDTMTWVWCSIKMAAVCLSHLMTAPMHFITECAPLLHLKVLSRWLSHHSLCGCALSCVASLADVLRLKRIKRNIGIRGKVFSVFLDWLKRILESEAKFFWLAKKNIGIWGKLFWLAEKEYWNLGWLIAPEPPLAWGGTAPESVAWRNSEELPCQGS